jgi:hypothetical protein
MFPSPRFVVVDDNSDHLLAISKTMSDLGSSCAMVPYSSEVDVPTEPFLAARAIFMDLQLASRSATADFNRHFAEIQRILLRVIPREGLAYLLILWTDRPDQAEALQAYLSANLYPSAPYARPLQILPLSKTKFINIDGTPVDALLLKTQILEHIGSNPALVALFAWESDILAASNQVLADVARIARREPDGQPELPVALKRLAIEAVGEHNVASDPQGAIHSALLPLLQDHVQQQAPVKDHDVTREWDRAFEGAPVPLVALTLGRAGALNSQLHLGSATSAVLSTTWGSVCLLEEGLNWGSEFGLSGSSDFIDPILGKLKAKKTPGAELAKLVQIRVGAACDYAQKIDGPIPYALAAFVPIAEGQNDPYRLMDGATTWISPALDVLDWGIGHFVVDPRFIRIRGKEFVSELKVVSRIREQLLIQLITTISQHGARPGTMQFSGES